MAKGEEDQHVMAQLKVLTGLKLPNFKWKANNIRMEFDIFKQTLEFMLHGMEIPKKKWYLYILQQFGREGMERWNASIKGTVELDNIKAFRKGFELEETYWTYRSLYLSSAKPSQGESAAALTTRVKDLVNMCEWPEDQKEQRRIDLFYHLTDFFDVKHYVQNGTAREGGNLTWDKLTEEAKHQECVGKEYARFKRENGGSGTPSYGDPALAADAISRGYKKPQPRSQTPSGGKGGGKSQQQCDQCRKHNGCTGLKETCPAWGKECGFCNGKNHYRAACRKAASSQKGGGAQPQQKQGKGKSPGKSSGKPKAKYAHSMVFMMVPSVKGIVSGMDERASVQNSVTSELSVPVSKAAKQGNPVLSGNIV